MQTAKFLLDSVTINVNIKEPNLESWADTIRKIREIDKKPDHLIREVISIATSDEFWSTVCLSPENLRRNWDKIRASMIRDVDRSNSLDKYKR